MGVHLLRSKDYRCKGSQAPQFPHCRLSVGPSAELAKFGQFALLLDCRWRHSQTEVRHSYMQSTL